MIPANVLKPELRSSLRPADVEAVRCLTQASGFFSAAEIDVAVELADDRVHKAERSEYRFLVADLGGQVIGYTCFGPIACTVHSFDLYWIVVDPNHQGMGLGRQLMSATERLILEEGGHRVYVETSSRLQYEATRAFYRRCSYREDAAMEDFYAPGDGKIVFVKAL